MPVMQRTAALERSAATENRSLYRRWATIIRPSLWQTPAAGVRACFALLASLDVFAVNCPLQFFPANPYDVVGSRFRRPAATVINFDPATRETTPGKRRYPHPMFTFLYGHRGARVLEIKDRKSTR